MKTDLGTTFESATSNDFDPDRLLGDTVDDNLIDADIISADIARDSEITATKLDDFATPDDNTDLNATTSYHGLLPKLDGNTTHYLNGNGSWASTISLDSTPDSNQTTSGSTATMTIDSSQTVIFGTVLKVASDGELEVADAGSSGTMPGLFLSLGTSTGSQTVLKEGFVRNDSWAWTPGSTLYVAPSPTGGDNLIQTQPSGSGQISQKVGIAISATVIWFEPDLTLVTVP